MNTYVDILVAPSTAPNWRIAVEKVVQEHDNMNAIFIYDVKRETKPLTKDSVQTPFRRMPSIEGTTFKHVLGSLSLGRFVVLCVGLASRMHARLERCAGLVIRPRTSRRPW